MGLIKLLKKVKLEFSLNLLTMFLHSRAIFYLAKKSMNIALNKKKLEDEIKVRR